MSISNDVGTFDNLQPVDATVAQLFSAFQALAERFTAQSVEFVEKTEELNKAAESFKQQCPDPEKLDAIERQEAVCASLQRSHSAVLNVLGDAAASQIDDGTVDGTRAATYALERRIRENPWLRAQATRFTEDLGRLAETQNSAKGASSSETPEPPDQY